MIRPLLILALVFAIPAISNSQVKTNDVIAAAGQSSNSPLYSVSWTIGEPVVTTLTGTNNILTQGFQQDYYYVITQINNYVKDSVNIRIYPNPAANFFYIELENGNYKDWNVRLVDMKGQVFGLKAFHASKLRIDIQNLASSTYLLIITDSKHNVIRSFKVQKIE